MRISKATFTLSDLLSVLERESPFDDDVTAVVEREKVVVTRCIENIRRTYDLAPLHRWKGKWP
jgi:hypothetical protein